MFHSDPFALSGSAFSSSDNIPTFGLVGRAAAWAPPYNYATTSSSQPQMETAANSSAAATAFNETPGGDNDVARLTAALLQWPSAVDGAWGNAG